MNYHIDIELLSDACFASGATLAVEDVDTATESDADGFPVISGRTLKGLLVEEATAVVQLFPALRPAAASLFGDTKQYGTFSLLSFGDGALPPAIRAAFRDHPDWNRLALTCVRRQTAIDRERGAAKEGSLRATRLIRAGLTLRSPIIVRYALSPQEKALLAASVAAVRRVGLHRNEGWGKVRCRLRDEQGVDQTGAWLALLNSDETSAQAPQTVPSLQAVSGGKTVIEFELELERPAVMADRSRGDWVTQSLSYLPGSALLGACATRWLAEHSVSDAACDETFRRLFLDGSVRWLNAYPSEQGQRCLPAPASWRCDDKAIFDQAHEEADEQWNEEPDPARWKGVKSGTFFRISDDEVRLLRPTTVMRMHHERDRELGRSQHGELFVHDALAAGQGFRGLVLCESTTDADVILSLLEGTQLAFGRSRTATYGGWARIISSNKRAGDGWSEAPSPSSGPRALLLASDYLGRTADGTADPEALRDELTAALGFKPESFYSVRREVHGLVGRWQMPRPLHVAVAAGSVIVLPPKASIDRARLAALLWQGIGERRAEGFGRVVALPSFENPETTCTEPGPVAPRAPAVVGVDGDAALLARIRRWVGEATLRPRLAQDGAALGVGLRRVSPSLIARVRQHVRTANSLEDVRDFLRDIQGKKVGIALARVQSGTSFEVSVVDRCATWQERFELPKGISWADLEASTWALQQHWLDAVLERWRQAAQQEAR